MRSPTHLASALLGIAADLAADCQPIEVLLAKLDVDHAIRMLVDDRAGVAVAMRAADPPATIHSLIGRCRSVRDDLELLMISEPDPRGRTISLAAAHRSISTAIGTLLIARIPAAVPPLDAPAQASAL